MNRHTKAMLRSSGMKFAIGCAITFGAPIAIAQALVLALS